MIVSDEVLRCGRKRPWSIADNLLSRNIPGETEEITSAISKQDLSPWYLVYEGIIASGCTRVQTEGMWLVWRIAEP